MTNESPIFSLDARRVASFSYPIQSITSHSHLLCGIDERGHIKVFEIESSGDLKLIREYTHSSGSGRFSEESWGMVRFSPSGKRVWELPRHSVLVAVDARALLLLECLFPGLGSQSHSNQRGGPSSFSMLAR